MTVKDYAPPEVVVKYHTGKLNVHFKIFVCTLRQNVIFLYRSYKLLRSTPSHFSVL